MKKLLAILVMAILSLTVVFAQIQSVDSQVIPGVVNMEPNDVVNVEYCVEYVNPDDSRVPAVGLSVDVDTWCRDTNGVFGCQAVDVSMAPEFSAVEVDSVTGADGCATIQLSTSGANGGVFYYTVNGAVEGEVVTEETATAYIPEMGIIGAMLVLGGAGLFIARKRQ